MPDLAIIDSHVHLWNPARIRMPWTDDNPVLNRPYSLDDYRQATEGLNIAGFVYLEVDVAHAYGLLEARELTALAAEDPLILGIVAWAPLEFGEQVRFYLDELVALGSKIKGIRRLTQGETDPNFCLQERFVRGTQILAEYGLSCDIGITHRQLGPSIDLVRQCPETSFVLDHIGKPDIRARQLAPWWDQIAELAELPNVVCKISGVTTETHMDRWTIEDIEPYVRRAMEVFGEGRIMYGSDWPVATQATTYRRWVETLDQLTADWSDEAKQSFWHDTASRVYRLSD